MTTSSAVDQKAASIPVITPASGGRWLAGFRNILGKELSDWFGTRLWWIQMLIWLIILNVGLALILFVAPAFDPQAAQGGPDGLYMSGLSVFFNTLALLGSIGVIILTQDEIIQEKQSGTAAWILTKPVSRASFIFSKLLSNIAGVLLLVIAVPALVAYIEIFIASGRAAPVLPYLQALGVMLLTLTFYITLSLMLGTFFEQRGPVLAGTFGILVGGLIVSQFVPKLTYILPLSMDKVAMSLLQGQPLSMPMMYELITAGLFSILFMVAALWRFSDEEF
ncbi:MAG TPA: ABC transporter permease [Anaerolineales bacterium]|nr:ABC transporter permease [Anaerolineales bacterium]